MKVKGRKSIDARVERYNGIATASFGFAKNGIFAHFSFSKEFIAWYPHGGLDHVLIIRIV